MILATSLFLVAFIIVARILVFWVRKKYNNDEVLREYEKAARRLEQTHISRM